METVHKKVKFQDWLVLILSCWLFISPWIIQYPASVPALRWNAHIVGAAIFLASLFAINSDTMWGEIAHIVLGVWLLASLWVLDAIPYHAITGNTLLVAICVIAVATWAIKQESNYEKWRDLHHRPF